MGIFIKDWYMDNLVVGSEWYTEHLKNVQRILRDVTKACRDDMHEPDEQGISAIFTGFYLDNANGGNPYNNAGEFTVGIKNQDGEIKWFNLADLLAIVRAAKL